MQISEPLCSVEGCPFPAARRGMCWMHYKRWLKYGLPGPVGRIGKKASIEERFIDHVMIGSCYLWTGYVHESGYGAIWSGHRLIYVHRYAWERAYGPIPVGARVRQTCRHKLCVREDHLELY